MNTTYFLRACCVTVGLMIGGTFRGNAVPVAFGGHYYDVILANSISWGAANTAANSSSFLGQSGHLVTITSAAEDAFVSGLLGVGLQYWAGGFQSPANELGDGVGWTWVNGEGSFPGVNGGSP